MLLVKLFNLSILGIIIIHIVKLFICSIFEVRIIRFYLILPLRLLIYLRQETCLDFFIFSTHLNEDVEFFLKLLFIFQNKRNNVTLNNYLLSCHTLKSLSSKNMSLVFIFFSSVITSLESILNPSLSQVILIIS